MLRKTHVTGNVKSQGTLELTQSDFRRHCQFTNELFLLHKNSANGSFLLDTMCLHLYALCFLLCWYRLIYDSFFAICYIMIHPAPDCDPAGGRHGKTALFPVYLSPFLNDLLHNCLPRRRIVTRRAVVTARLRWYRFIVDREAALVPVYL